MINFNHHMFIAGPLHVFGLLIVLGFIGIVIALGVAAIVFWIWMLVSAIQNRSLSEGEKIGWILAIALLHVLGALLYLVFGHPKRLQAPPQPPPPSPQFPFPPPPVR